MGEFQFIELNSHKASVLWQFLLITTLVHLCATYYKGYREKKGDLPLRAIINFPQKVPLGF